MAEQEQQAAEEGGEVSEVSGIPFNALIVKLKSRPETFVIPEFDLQQFILTPAAQADLDSALQPLNGDGIQYALFKTAYTTLSSA